MVADTSGWLQASNQDLSVTPDRVLVFPRGASAGACCLAVDKPQPTLGVAADCTVPASGPATMILRPVQELAGSVAGCTVLTFGDPRLQSCLRIAVFNVLGKLDGH